MIIIQYYSLSQTSLKLPPTIVEYPIPLWFADGTAQGDNSTTSGVHWIKDGSSGGMGISITSETKLHALNSNWASSQKFAFEATLYVSSSGTAYTALWDMTSNSIVSSSQLSTTSATATVLRSGQFTLTLGHIYGVTLWNLSAGYSNICDASLIVFGS